MSMPPDYVRCIVSVTLVISRRGHPDMADIDILLFHLGYTTPPLPSLIRGSRHILDAKKPQWIPTSVRSQARPPPHLLGDAVIAPLQKRGLIASVLSIGSSRWQGIVNVQQSDKELLRRLDIK